MEAVITAILGLPLILVLVASLLAGPYYGYWRLRRKGYTPFASGLLAVTPYVVGITLPMFLDLNEVPLAGVIACTLMVILSNSLLLGVVRLMPFRLKRTSGARRPRFPWVFAGRVSNGLAVLAAILAWAAWQTQGPGVAQFIGGVFLFIGLGKYLKGMPARLESAAQAAQLPPGTATVLYLRAFQQESAAFVIGPKAEYGRYTRSLTAIQAEDHQDLRITLEDFLDQEIEKQLGAFLALGNPEDYIPPEGARRIYAPDRGWMERFQELASTARVILIEMSRSGNLTWELKQILEKGWASKLYVLTRPAPNTLTGMAWKTDALLLWLRGLPRGNWKEFSEDLNQLGYGADPGDPGEGAVVTFDGNGRSRVLCRGAKLPEEFISPIKAHVGE